MPVVVERIVLALLLLASLTLFARNFGAKIRLIREGAPERVRTDHARARLARAAREVLVQTRVIGGRPVVGVLHAFVFLGFLLFAPVTVEHFASGFGFSVLEPLLGHRLLHAYGALMVVVASLVAIGIAGLAFRRFVMVRISPDPKSVTSAIVATFIFVLMLTYLDGTLFPRAFAPDAPLGRANWWVHALIILVFPHLIIKSKHFHILLAPVAVYLRTPRLGELLPIDLEAVTEGTADDVALGLETIKSIPWKLRLDFMSCVECRRCTENCPSALAGNDTDPRGYVLAGRKALASCAPDDAVVGNVVGESGLGFCVTCGACENGCPVGVEHLQLLVGTKRAQALATGKGVVAQEFFHAIEAYGNPFSLPRSERRQMVEDLELPPFRGDDDEWLLWLGCVWGYNRDQRGAVAAFKRVLDAAGVKYGVLAQEPCCGHHSRRQGEETQFQELARQVNELFVEKNVTRVVTPCPHCLHSLRHDEPQLDGERNVTVVHHSQLIAELVGSGALPLAPAARANATYHDPCYLARYEHETAAPRRVLDAAGIELHELPHHRERTLCCGGGAAGFVREIRNGKRVDQPRRAELLGSGVPLLVTACPECRMMLDAALDDTKDIAEIVAASLASPAPGRREEPAIAGRA